MIYTNLINTYSYVPLNFVKNKEGLYFSEVLRNMNSYPNPNDKDNAFRSMLIDGGKIAGLWFFVRFVFDAKSLGKYAELNNIYYKFTVLGNTTK
jgi:hypothetical protein